mmetsp:Transcript_32569/g.53992  ORF Transcript_32569/g.53992 Transcript_32569/m.53992 type:complete len:92 (+) Transcript_32569:570-845(+)
MIRKISYYYFLETSPPTHVCQLPAIPEHLTAGVVRGVELATNKGRPYFVVCFLLLVEKLLAAVVVLFLFEGADAHCIIMTLMTFVSFRLVK